MEKLDEITQKIYELLTGEFKMKPTIVNNDGCFELNGEYYKITVFTLNQPIYCVEWAENLQDARNGKFEDSYVYGKDLGTKQIIKMLRDELSKDIGG